MRYILWSGGWDSTYLLCKRARESEETIQPVYVNYRHGNAVNERKRRNTLIGLIRGKSDIKAKINSPIEIEEDALPQSEEYDAAYGRLKEKIESMYGDNMFRFMGRIALIFPQPEIAIEAPIPGVRSVGRIEQLMKDGGLEIDDEGKITPGVGDPDILLVFGCYQYPIRKITEIQMIEDVKSWGYFDDVFQNTWSCYSGLDRQCGVCHACEVKWGSGDAFLWRFDERAQKDHAIKEYLKTIDEENGTGYAELFTNYVMNGDWVTVNNGSSTLEEGTDEYKSVQQKSENIMGYFSYLENNWPNAKDINAPTI